MQLARGPLRGVAAATLIMLGALTAWTVVTPAFRSADEPTHFSAVSRLARLHTWPTVGHVYQDPAVPAAISAVGFVDVPWADNPALGDPSLGQGPEAPTMVELRDQSTVTTGDEASSIHPPGYYAFLAGFYSGLGLDRATPSGALLSLRLAGLLLMLPIPYLCAIAATELGLGGRGAVAAAFVPVGWIQLLHVGAGINNGNMVVLTTAAVTALLIPVMTRDAVSLRRAVAVGLIAGIGLAAKAFALCLLPMIAVAYLAASRRVGRRAWLSLAAALAASIPGLALLLRSSLGGALQPPGTSTASGTSTGAYARESLLDLSGSLWANLGWLNTPLPTPLHLTATIAAIAAMVAGSWRLRRNLPVLAVLYGAWLGPLTMITLWSLDFYRHNGFVDGMQGRYLTGAIVTFAVLLVAALGRWQMALRVAPPVSVVAAIGGLLFGMRSFWEGADPRTMLAWWPHGDLVLAMAGVVFAAGVVLAALPQSGRSGGPGADGSPRGWRAEGGRASRSST